MIHVFQDIQQAVESLPGVRLNYRQLEQGPLRLSLELQAIGDIGASMVSLDRIVDGCGTVDPGQAQFVLCLGGGEHRYDDLTVVPGQVYVKAGGFSPGHQLLKPGYRHLMFNLPLRLLGDHLRCPPCQRLEQGCALKLSTEDLRGIWELVRGSSLAPQRDPRQFSDLLTTALCHGLRLESADDLPVRADSKTQLARAIRDRLQECPEMTLGDICRQLCVSERTLRRVFCEVYSVSPSQYHLALRLNQVRSELKAHSVRKRTVSEIAARGGFWHMGRFSYQYRRHFGETPMQTLADRPRRLI